ncbi:L,D-transpeptidase family protein [Paenibacillus kobensis]|uniref:L,D-transpeptidase family protein n=1 Tax=Paenibacillus kobensis TaxID=59841 RepID=UPI001FE50355|nr:L,D-transpeptidase family protein [Paenibacillus kobensis]
MNKKTNKLAFYDNGELIKTFPVATGRTSKLTPEGSFKIVNKIKDRPYYKEKIAGGDPRNPLGDRWMGLEVNGTYGTTYAIHGNNNSKSIGKYVSSGCIRMYNDDIHWLFPQIEIGTKAILTTSDLSFDKIAEEHDYPILKFYDGALRLNGKKIDLETKLIVIDSRVYIPMREIFEIIGATVKWNNKTQTVTAVVNGRTIKHKPPSNIVNVDGKDVEITVSKVIDNTVMLPIRNISELTGYKVEWNAKAKEIRLTGTKK